MLPILCLSLTNSNPFVVNSFPPFASTLSALVPYKRCLNHGILSHKKSGKLEIIVTERKRRQRLGITGPSKSSNKSSSPAPPKKKKAKIKIKKESGAASPVKSANL